MSEIQIRQFKVKNGFADLEKALFLFKEAVDRDGEKVAEELEALRTLIRDELPMPFDPLRLGMAVKPARPELFDVYSNSVLVLLDQSSYLFTTKFPVDNKNLFLSKLVETMRLTQQVKGNFEAYKTGKGSTVCLRPRYGDPESIYAVDYYRPGKRLQILASSREKIKCKSGDSANIPVNMHYGMGSHRSDNRMLMFPPDICKGAK